MIHCRYPETVVEVKIGTLALGLTKQTYHDFAICVDTAFLQPVLSPMKEESTPSPSPRHANASPRGGSPSAAFPTKFPDDELIRSPGSPGGGRDRAETTEWGGFVAALKGEGEVPGEEDYHTWTHHSHGGAMGEGGVEAPPDDMAEREFLHLTVQVCAINTPPPHGMHLVYCVSALELTPYRCNTIGGETRH